MCLRKPSRREGVKETTGQYNTANGYAALMTNTEGIDKTALGYAAGYFPSESFTGENNIFIGSLVGPLTSNELDTIRLVRFQTQTFIAGIYNSILSVGTAVYVNSSGRLGTVSSSRLYKEDIEDMGGASDGLMNLRPVTFCYKPEYTKGPRVRQYGLIAEEVADIYPVLVHYNPDTGQPQTVSYHLINAMLLNLVQQQRRRLNELEERLANIESMIR